MYLNEEVCKFVNTKEITKIVKQQKDLQCLIYIFHSYIYHNVSQCPYVTIIPNVHHRNFKRL